MDYRPHKTKPNRTRLTVGGNLINHPGNVSTLTSDTTTTKIVSNSTISTPKAKYLVGDLKNFYLGTTMTRYEYLRISINIIPQEIIYQYNLLPLVRNSYVYIEIQRGIYGIPQAGILANNQLTERLEPKGYYQCRHTPGLWRQKWRPKLFSLVVNDFGIKYVRKEHADHLIVAIKDNYKFSTDWGGTLYCSITTNWYYANHTVNLSMPNYISSMLHKY